VAGILTGANAIPVNIQNSSRGPVAGLNTQLSRPSVSTRFNFGATAQPSVSNEFKGILGKGPAHPFCSRCLAQDHLRLVCPNLLRCSNCYELGHSFGNCRLPPRSTRLPNFHGIGIFYHSNNHHSSITMTNGPSQNLSTRRFASVRDFLHHITGTVPPSPIIIPWSRPLAHCCTRVS
jgi:hypothetical protein